MSYSPFFQALHDETQPVGHLGRGTHYSVLRVPIWHDERLKPLPQGDLLDFAIIWDEDHDTRVIEPIEEMYFAGLLAPVRFVGERKGTLSVLIDSETPAWDEKSQRNYDAAVRRTSQSLDDPWPVTESEPLLMTGSIDGSSSDEQSDSLEAFCHEVPELLR